MERKPVLQAKNIYKAFNYPAKMNILKGIDLSVFGGETIAIMGRSGEGKSTLLQILGTLESPCSGELEIGGRLVANHNKCAIRNQEIAFVFQSFHLLEDYTALENILMPARIGRQRTDMRSDAYQRGLHLLNQVGLSARAHYNTKLLSGGEKQRVAIARALCNNPALILADEPSGNLDKQTSADIHEILLGFAKNENKALIVVTHDQELANLCNRRFVLSHGTLHIP